jgi:O-succinylbenzoic acid--CoA ligase
MTGRIDFTSPSSAIITPGKSITYSELGSIISSLASHIKSRGITENENVGVLMNNSPDFIAVVFALWKLNAVPVLLNTRLTAKEINDLLTANGVKSVITISKYADKLKEDFKLINLDNERIEKINESSGINFYRVIIFTSGSTGQPKAVALNASSFINSISAGNTVLNQSERDKWLASLPFYHIGGFMIFLRAFAFGATVIIPENLRLEEIKFAFEKYKPTLASLVPTQLQRLIESSAVPNPELRNLLIGGGSIEQQMISDALNNGWPVSSVYGATETTSFVAYASAAELKMNPGASGKAVYPNKIEIIDNGVIEGDPAGEIVIESPALFEKYLNDPGETEHKLVNGKYYTGDYGILDQNGYLYVLSRRTDMIVSGGENIDPVEIEKAIMQFPGIKDVCVFGRNDDEWGEVVNAAVLADESFKEKELTDFLKKDLATYKIPKHYFIVEEIPRTVLGKIRREKVSSMFNKQ